MPVCAAPAESQKWVWKCARGSLNSIWIEPLFYYPLDVYQLKRNLRLDVGVAALLWEQRGVRRKKVNRRIKWVWCWRRRWRRRWGQHLCRRVVHRACVGFLLYREKRLYKLYTYLLFAAFIFASLVCIVLTANMEILLIAARTFRNRLLLFKKLKKLCLVIDRQIFGHCVRRFLEFEFICVKAAQWECSSAMAPLLGIRRH